MQTVRALIPLGLALVLALSVLAPAASAQPATLPAWQVGQEVAYGVTVPIGQEIASILDEVRANPGAFNITHINELNATGSLDSWVDQQVTVVTSSAYTLHTVSATGITLHVVVNATFNNLPAAGTYPGTNVSGVCMPARIPPTNGTLAVTLDLMSLTSSDGTTNFAVSNLAIQNDTTNATVQTKGTADLFNIPVPTTNTTSCVTTVAYKSENLGIAVNTQDLARTLFSPALDVFHFPISDGATWWANSSATFAGNFTGTIDVTGLSAHDQQAFFDNLTQAFRSVPGLAVSGLDRFPIDLSQILIMEGRVALFDHGTLHDTSPYPIALHLRAKEGNMSLADGQLHEVFYLFQDTGTACPAAAYGAVYSPTYPAAGQGMIVGYAAFTCSGGAVQPLFELHSTPPGTAKGNIRSTEANYQVFTPGGTNALADFFLQAPYWGLLLVAAVVIVVVALLVVRRRRHAAAPPPPPPPSPP